MDFTEVLQALNKATLFDLYRASCKTPNFTALYLRTILIRIF